MQGSGDDEAVLLGGRLGTRHTHGTTHGLHVPQLRSGGSGGGSSGVEGRGHTQRTQCSFNNKQECADHAGQDENNESVLSEKLTTAALAFFFSFEMSNSSDDLCWKNCPDFYRASNHCGFESCSFASCQADLQGKVCCFHPSVIRQAPSFAVQTP